MSALKKYWKVLLALILAVAAVPVFCAGYLGGRGSFAAERDALETEIRALQTVIVEGARYADMQEQIAQAGAELEQSREELYQHFPKELLEEEQIMYLLRLEQAAAENDWGDVGYNVDLYEHFMTRYGEGTGISFSFGQPQPILLLSDGILQGVTITVYFETTYDGFKDMVQYIATDDRITSIQDCTLDYDADADTATGSLNLLCYILSSDLPGLTQPVTEEPDVGKPNLFD